MCEMGPPDLRPTSSTAAAYQRNIDRAHGRYLAGLGEAGWTIQKPVTSGVFERTEAAKSVCLRRATGSKNPDHVVADCMYNVVVSVKAQAHKYMVISLLVGLGAGYFFGKRK
jgi:hypothetical protein